jgi:hypothetical protein
MCLIDKHWSLLKMGRLPFSYVSYHVDRLYDRPIDESDLESISKQCNFIAEFIKECGWNEESYFRALMGDEPLDKTAN